jgi:hypothetical protein
MIFRLKIGQKWPEAEIRSDQATPKYRFILQRISDVDLQIYSLRASLRIKTLMGYSHKYLSIIHLIILRWYLGTSIQYLQQLVLLSVFDVAATVSSSRCVCCSALQTNNSSAPIVEVIPCTFLNDTTWLVVQSTPSK